MYLVINSILVIENIMLMSYSYSYSDLGAMNLFMVFLPTLIVWLVCFLICLKIASSKGASKAFCLLGFFGVIGIILTAVITSNRQNVNNNNYPNGAGGYPNNAGGYPNGAGGYPNNAGGYPNNAGGYPNMGMGDYQDGQNYEFKGSMNVCGTHDGENETYDSAYEGYDERHDYSYNLNGETIKAEKNICHHCGAKIKPLSRYCEECGSRV